MEADSIKGLGKAKLTSIINAEACILQKAGLGVGIYCNRYWYYNILDTDYLKQNYPFWIARYPDPDKGTLNLGSNLNPRNYAAAWQYSQRGKVNGITGYVDLDVSFGKLADLFLNTRFYEACSEEQTSIIAGLIEVGEKDTSLAHRKRIGVANGIAGVGTVNGNIQMLNLLKDGRLKKRKNYAIIK